MTKDNTKFEPKEDIIDPRIDEFKIFAEEFRGESDRSAVILGAVKIDTLLEELLSKYMVSGANGKNDFDLLGDFRPLNSFSSRISACYRLGLVDYKMAKALKNLNIIRTKFAHYLEYKSLDYYKLKGIIENFVQELDDIKLYKGLLKKYFIDRDTYSAKFRAGVALISLRLVFGRDHVKQITPNNAIRIESE